MEIWIAQLSVLWVSLQFFQMDIHMPRLCLFWVLSTLTITLTTSYYVTNLDKFVKLNEVLKIHCLTQFLNLVAMCSQNIAVNVA